MPVIQYIVPRQILDSRGNPTVEVDLLLNDGSFGRASVPSGASTGDREALELHDGGQPFLGKGVHKATSNVEEAIAPELIGQDWTQETLDQKMVALDGTPNKSRLGANALLAVSLAFSKAQAQSQKIPLYKHLNQVFGQRQMTLPRPMCNIMNGGAHANWTTDIQEYMIVPNQTAEYPELLRKCVEVFHHLGLILKNDGHNINVGNEGGYAPEISSNEEAFVYILKAIEAAGYTAGNNGDFLLAVDIAASEFYQNNRYALKRDETTKSSEEMVQWIVELTQEYPLYSIEDGLDQNDTIGWHALTEKIGKSHLIVGDDFLTTNVQFINSAVQQKNANAVIIKPNQIGTLSEAFAATRATQAAGWEAIPSHRSGETEDTFLAHFAVAVGAEYIKTGAPSRVDRTSKYNELLRISESLNTERTV